MAYIHNECGSRPGLWLRRSLTPMVAAAGLMIAANADAAIVESLTSTTSYNYGFIPGVAGTVSGVGPNKAFEVSGPDAGKATDVQMNYGSVVAADASFFFLHNIQCQGYCTVGVTTLLTNTVTNTGLDTVDIRLDSDITAGHLGLVKNSNTRSSGQFEFNITQTTGNVDRQLYQALGQVSSTGASIVTSDGSLFNNLTSYRDAAQIGLDWDATGISVLLGSLAPGASTTVTYSSVTYLNSYGICSNFNRCDGVQVAFGDPRNNGGIIGARTVQDAVVKQPVGFVLNRGFDMAQLKLDVVQLAAVPEPASWALMLLGFGATGAALRRQRPIPRPSALVT